ncbi:uncharacterized protein CTHT_0028240 [Thermochaetoides thermophila DSM 1495]|uniref:Uncharacterized protein n=1 Tax=Chaetomium thermophilum (strain DSM 1495 / CBS 144.50 / IMI 039719) TaxID=759272 RepID=G0S7I3_CHATD|nr:hypothetical protein CTHT_0028240 [Thermochaetoides thermophila DSM 1495]EGS20985.1 hypothetical protein CTHT_0028240 [Thermochaetoides thermophila DSM 1495]
MSSAAGGAGISGNSSNSNTTTNTSTGRGGWKGKERESIPPPPSHSSAPYDQDDIPQTVGTLLASIATCMTDALDALSQVTVAADSQQLAERNEHLREMELALDEAKQDFQELAPLVHGRGWYENDRSEESLAELEILLTHFTSHSLALQNWAFSYLNPSKQVQFSNGALSSPTSPGSQSNGSPIDPRMTPRLRKALHRAQRRAAHRVFAAQHQEEQSQPRCLGAWLVYRQLRRRHQVGEEGERSRERQRRKSRHRAEEREGLGLELEELPSNRGQDVRQHEKTMNGGYPDNLRAQGSEEMPYDCMRRGSLQRRGSLEELVPHCNYIGRFQRLASGGNGELLDAAFVCDFCNGYIVWSDLQDMPSERTPRTASSDAAAGGYPHWQARGHSATTGEEKTIVFAPLAIANHTAPEPGEWQAGLVCPYCEEATYLDAGEDSSEVKYVQDEKGFADLRHFQEHLEWYHTAAVPSLSELAAALPPGESCNVM